MAALQQLSSPAEAARFLAERVRGALRSDSREVQPGDGFVAWPGHMQDARRYVGAALAAGAAACLVEREGAEAYALDDARVAALPGLKAAAGVVAAIYHGAPSRRLEVVAVTGTNGKTSTAWWTAQALGALGRRCGVVGTLGIGEPGPGIETSGLTTPNPLALHGAFRRFADAGYAACAIEASSIGIVEQRLAGVHIAVAQYTNLTRDHLDYHGSMAAYWDAKRALFDWPGLRAAVINIDDEHGAALAAELSAHGRLDVRSCSLHGGADLVGAGLHYEAGGLAFDVVEGSARAAVRSALVGDYNASNLLVVIGALRALGVALADAAAVVPRLVPVPGRLQPVVIAGAAALPHVLVDYAHTPDALDKVLQAVRPLARQRGGALWCVFGCGGNRDATKRPLMGAIAESLADRVVLTSDNPRDEPPCFILSQILAGVVGHAGVDVIEDRAAAIAHAVALARPDDVVVIAGKGHETTQEVAGVKRPFSDAEVAAAALRARAAGTAGAAGATGSAGSTGSTGSTGAAP